MENTRFLPDQFPCSNRCATLSVDPAGADFVFCSYNSAAFLAAVNAAGKRPRHSFIQATLIQPRIHPDFMATAAYKWQFCPYGIAFLYVDKQYFDGVPIEEAWMSRDGAEDFSRLAEFTDLCQAGARRFDMGEKSSFSNVAGASAALQMLQEWNIDTISKTLADTNARIAEILTSHGFETMPAEARAPHFQGARLPATDPRKLAAGLIDKGVYASVRGEYLRVAPHLYTDDEDLTRFDEALDLAGF